jgi:hypothetical protein
MLRWVPGSCTRTIRRCRVAHPLWVRRPPGENPRYGSRTVVASPEVHCGPGYPGPPFKTTLNWSLLPAIPLRPNTERILVADGECCGHRHMIRGDPSKTTVSDYQPRAVNPAHSPFETRRIGGEGIDEGRSTAGLTRPAGRTRRCSRRTWRAAPSGRNRWCAAREPSSRRLRISRRGGCPSRRRSGRRCEAPHD